MEIVEIVEREKTCPRCGVIKLWSEYHARTRWPDGTVRRVQSHCKECDANRGALKGREYVSAKPFAAWIERVMVRDGLSRLEVAEQFGISDRQIRRILKEGQPTVEVGTVDRVLTADGAIMLRELYPSLYEAG